MGMIIGDDAQDETAELVEGGDALSVPKPLWCGGCPRVSVLSCEGQTPPPTRGG
jgi:hypothetical protein